MKNLKGRKIEAMHARYGTIPEKRCKDCPLLCCNRRNRRYYKCVAYGDTPSEASDWVLSWMACGLHDMPQLPKEHIPIIEQLKHAPRTRCQPDPPIEGQIDMEGYINEQIHNAD